MDVLMKYAVIIRKEMHCAFQAIPTVPFLTTSMDIPPNPNFLFKKSLTLPPKTAEICSTPPQIWPKLVKSVHTHQKNGTLDVYGNFP